MALKSSYISILKAIKEAPHAVPFETMNGLIADNLSCVVGNLVEAGYIKSSAGGSGYFTRTPKRDAIMDFLTGRTETLDGITFDPDGMIPASNYRQILSDIINAPEALSAANIHPGMDDELFDTAIRNLKSAKLIKEHAGKSDFYFTRRPMRDKIRGFIAGTVSLTQLLDYEVMPTTGTAPLAAPVSAPCLTTPQPHTYLGLPVAAFRDVLSRIYGSEHALDINNRCTTGDAYCIDFDMLVGILAEAGLVKEHRDKPNHYFTRKPMRRAIELFLEDEIGIEELFERAAQRAAEAATSETPQAVVPQAPGPDTTPLCEMDEAFEAYLFESMDANLLTLRAAIDAAQRAYDALAAYRGR